MLRGLEGTCLCLFSQCPSHALHAIVPHRCTVMRDGNLSLSLLPYTFYERPLHTCHRSLYSILCALVFPLSRLLLCPRIAVHLYVSHEYRVHAVGGVTHRLPRARMV